MSNEVYPGVSDGRHLSTTPTTTAGTCYFWADGEDTEEQVRFYLDVALGPDWRPSIILAMVAWILSVLVFFYTTSFCCSAQVRRFRFFAGISISVVLPLVQGLSFLVLRSSWCDVEDCQSSRGGDFCIMAVILFFLAGQCFFFMSNFPGAKYIEAMEQQGDVEMITVADAVVISEREVVIAPEDVISTEGVTFAEAVVLDPQHEEGDGSTEENHPAGAPNNVEKMTEPHEATANCAEQAVTEEVMVEEGEYSNDNGETQPGDDVVDVAEGEDIVERCETASPNDRPVTPSNTATTFGAAQDRQKAEKSHCDES